MVAPNRLAHVVLYTANIPTMRDWYKNVLAARVVHENPAAVFLTYDDEHHRIALADRDAISAQGTSGVGKLVTASGTDNAPAATANRGLAHIAFTYDSLSDLLENHARLKDDGIAPIFSINHGTTTSLYYADPDGNNIELQVDNFDTVLEGTAYMESASFTKNPIGEPIDPDNLSARLRAGESEKTLLQPWW